jgi:hypothetical protein
LTGRARVYLLTHIQKEVLMAIEATILHISPLLDSIEVDVQFSEEPGPPYVFARVTIYVELRDWSLSELRAETIQRAKDFLSQVVSSPQS